MQKLTIWTMTIPARLKWTILTITHFSQAETEPPIFFFFFSFFFTGPLPNVDFFL
jgi:hypothetical protein